MVTNVVTHPIDAHAIIPILRRRERVFRAKIAVMLAFGLPLSLLGPFMLGTIFWFVCLLLWHWYPWSWFFGSAVLVIVPLLYRMVLRGGDYLMDAVKASGASPDASAGLWALSHIYDDSMLATVAIAAHPQASAAGFVELFLFGPRQVVSAIRQWRAARLMQNPDLTLAANILALLLRANRSLETRQLPAADKMSTLAPVLAYLVFHDWIGLSANADKTWLLTSSRESFQAVTNHPA